MDFESHLTAHSLQNLSWGGSIKKILGAALQVVEPGAAIHRWMSRQGNILHMADREYRLESHDKVLLIGVGKAAVPMGLAADDILGPYFSEGILLTKDGYAGNLAGKKSLPGLLIWEAGHPIPDERGLSGARRIVELLAGTGADDLVICLISGGGSALMPSPVEGVRLADLQELTTALLTCGATINEINLLRKHLDTLKGGGLARLAYPAALITLILSDVVDDPLDVIASGPTVPDPTTYEDAMAAMTKYKLKDKCPPSIIRHFQNGLRGEVSETPKPGDKIFDHVQNIVVGSNRLAADAAVEQANREGFHTLLLTTSLQGEAGQTGRKLASIAREIADHGKPVPRPACIIAGGETTVVLHGDGLGGRNQELALGAVETLAGIDKTVLVTLATDGGDGPTDAAGAVVTGDTLFRAREHGLSPAIYLSRNDSYHFFDALDDLLKPGPTQTNVNDLTLIFVR